MVSLGTWRFWVIVALALTTLACAGRRERREAQRERREAAREERRDRLERQRAEREQQYVREPQQPREQPVAPPPQRPALTPTVAVTAAAPAAVAAAADESAKVVFFRPSKQTSDVDAMLFDVTEPGEPKLIGSVNAATKFTYSLQPGLYTFMVVGETAEFMQATIVGGKTYYALVIPKAGARRFAIEPVRQHEIGGKDFTSWDRSTRPTSGDAKAVDSADAAQKRVRYWQEDWMKKSDTQRAELTLNAEDGR